MEFRVSVIIPVFNCEEFIRKAVKSALSCPEVFEIILVEDGSTDLSLSVCKELSLEFERVKLFFHEDNKNLGPSISRNLGVLNANEPFIAFLDGDDWYLNNRFKKDKIVFNSFPDAEAVYSCSVLEEDLTNGGPYYGVSLSTFDFLASSITPLEFYKKVLENRIVLFNTNGITFKSKFLLNNKLFDKRLLLHQDTELWLRLMRIGNFCASEFEIPTSVIRRHSRNRIKNRGFRSKLLMICVLIDNISIERLFAFEIKIYYSDLLRIQSNQFSTRLIRRAWFYFFYFFYFFFRKNYIRKVVSNQLNV